MGEADDEGGGRFVGPYRLLDRVGRGGFGEVFRAEAPDGTSAAVKLLHASWAGDAEMRRRFAAEVEQARRVNDFCVAAILDADPAAEYPWIASEYIDGPTLEAAVREQGPPRGSDLHRLAVTTATALTAIHGAGVVHRDLKPDNILLAADGPRVIDFGIARAVEATSMTASGIIGTIGYMAPEQLEGARLSAAVDVFAWGAVLIYAATGREAFPAPTQAARTTRVLTGDPDTGDLDEPLLSVALACLEKDPERRPSARALLDMLLGVREGRPSAAGPAPRPAGCAPADGAADACTERAPAAAEGETRVGPDPTRVDAAAQRQHGAVAERPGTLPYTSLAPEAATAHPATHVPDAPPLDWPAGPVPASPAPAGDESPGRSGAPPRPSAEQPVPAGGPELSGAADTSGSGGGGTPPYWFAGARYTDPGALAEAMQRNWTTAARIFGDEQERTALGSWMVDDIGDTATDRSVYRRRPDDANLAVTWFVAQLRPDLRPVFRGRDASPDALRRRFTEFGPAFTGAPPDNELVLLARPEVLRLLALHEAAGAAELHRVADGLVTAEQAAVGFRDRLAHAVPRIARHAGVDSALILLLLLHDKTLSVDADGHPEVELWYRALWSGVEREKGAARAGAVAVAVSSAGAVRAAALRCAEWSAALRQAEGERDTAAADCARRARSSRAELWVGRSPLAVLAFGAAYCVWEAVAASAQPSTWAVWGVLVMGVWVLSRVAAWTIRRFSGPREGFATPLKAAQARFYRARDHAAHLAQGVDGMRRELEALRAACGAS